MTILVLLSLCSGCVTAGILYTHVTEPLDTNMDKTPAGSGKPKGSIKYLQVPSPDSEELTEIPKYKMSVKHIQVPLPVPVDFVWDSAAVADIAQKSGLKTLYYSDVEILRVLGVWNRYTLHLYGE